jgi:hypothetical protein
VTRADQDTPDADDWLLVEMLEMDCPPAPNKSQEAKALTRTFNEPMEDDDGYPF